MARRWILQKDLEEVGRIGVGAPSAADFPRCFQNNSPPLFCFSAAWKSEMSFPFEGFVFWRSLFCCSMHEWPGGSS